MSSELPMLMQIKFSVNKEKFISILEGRGFLPNQDKSIQAIEYFANDDLEGIISNILPKWRQNMFARIFLTEDGNRDLNMTIETKPFFVLFRNDDEKSIKIVMQDGAEILDIKYGTLDILIKPI